MNEISLQNLFENYLIKNNIPYKREFKCLYNIIDFKMFFSGKECGVEVKSDKGKLDLTIGQLILENKTFSNLYLFAEEEFIHNFEEIILETGVLNDIGLITLKDGEFIFLRHPFPKKYYFNEPESRKRVNVVKYTSKNVLISDYDYFLLTIFKEKAFDTLTIMNHFKISRGEAYRRIRRLISVGLLEEVNKFNPKTYRVKKYVEYGTKIPISSTQNKI